MSLHLYWCSQWQRRHAFVGMPKIEGAPTAETLFELCTRVLQESVGLSADDFARKLVQLACDGASVLQGSQSGLGVRLLAIAPFLLLIHCHAHRLDLVAGTLKLHAGFEIATALSLAPVGFYARSTKRLDALKAVCYLSVLPFHAALA